MARVIVGLSGGVDSAAAAYLLQKQGHEVIGVTLRTWETGGSRCCEIDAARAVAQFLEIPYHVIHCAQDFARKVEAPFTEDYLRGVTPNPCVLCNQEIKWAWMCYAAGIFQADAVATGHYVSRVLLQNGRYTVRQAADRKKDQSYMLWRLTQEQLAQTIFPLGELTKETVRRMTAEAGMPSSDRTDSQEICFVARGSYADYIREHAPDGASPPGNFVDEQGNVLGRHRGIIHYTVGQRRGLGVAAEHPLYVLRILPETNEIVLGGARALCRDEILCGDVRYLSLPGLAPGKRIRAVVKVRYQHAGGTAILEPIDAETVRIRFDTPVRAPAPGQSAVFYDEDHCVVGGGIILPQ